MEILIDLVMAEKDSGVISVPDLINPTEETPTLAQTWEMTCLFQKL